LLASACAAPPPHASDPADAPLERGAGRTCAAHKAKVLIGRTRSAKTEAEARRLTGAGAIRWVPMGAMVTMDYRPDRLNIHLDRHGRIRSLDCG
jgi:hypothetical protein